MSLDVLAFDPASDAAALAEFLALPARVYADDPKWIPTFKEALAASLCGPPLGEGHRWQAFLARRDGEPVARCVATINPDLVHEGQEVGAIGTFEALDDAEAIAAILAAARTWLGEQGRGAEIWGPFGYSIYHPYRFMSRGFEREPFFGEPYNPTYYPERWKEAGFADLAQWYSWDLAKPHLQGMHHISFQLRNDALSAGGYGYEPFDVGAGFERDLRRVYEVLVASFAPNLGATQLGFPAFADAYGPMRTFVNGEVAPILTNPEGETIGLGFTYPDPAAAFRELGGDVSRLAELPGLLAASPPESLVFHTMAVLPQHRRKGLVEAYLNELLERAFAAGISRGIGALAKEGPTIYDKTGPSSRQYTLYRYAG